MIDILSRKVASHVKENAPDHPASFEVIRYSASLLLNAVFIIGISSLIALFTGNLLAAIIALAAFPILRQVSGGVHLKTNSKCIVLSVSVITAISFCADLPYGIIMALNFLNCLLAAIYAPSRISLKIPVRFYPYLKLASILLVASNFLILSSVLAVTFFVQCLTLIRGRRKEG